MNLTDQFMLRAGCRYIYTKHREPGMHPADNLDDISKIKYNFHTCHSCVPMPQASRRNFHESCIYTDIAGASPVNRTFLGQRQKLMILPPPSVGYN